MLKNCTPLWRNAHLKVKMLKNWRSGTTFGSSDAEKLYAAVAKSTFASQNVQNTVGSDHFWKFRCRKIARRCGEMHIWKSKCYKTVVLGAFLDVLLWKNCLELWRNAHVQEKMFLLWSAEHFSTFWWPFYARQWRGVCNWMSQLCGRKFPHAVVRACFFTIVVCGALFDVLMTIVRKAVTWCM